MSCTKKYVFFLICLYYITTVSIATCFKPQRIIIREHVANNTVYNLCSYSSHIIKSENCRSGCPRGLRRGSAAVRLLGLWVRIPPEAWMSVCCECCVLSGRGLCDGLITRLEESYRLCCVLVCDLETSWMRRPWPTGGLFGQKKIERDGRHELVISFTICGIF